MNRLIAVLLVAAKGQQESQTKAVVVNCTRRYGMQLLTAHCDTDIDYTTGIQDSTGYPVRMEISDSTRAWV